MPALTFSQLLKQSFAVLRAKWLSFLGFLALSVLVMTPFVGYVIHAEIVTNQAVATQFGMLPSDVADFKSWSEEASYYMFDEVPPIPENVEAALAASGKTAEDLQAAIDDAMQGKTTPFIVMYLISIILLYGIMTGMWLTALPQPPTFMEALRKGFSLLPKLIGLVVLSFFASFLWVPFVLLLAPGAEMMLIPAFLLAVAWCIYFMPRLVPVFVLLLTKPLPLTEMVRTGLAASRGYWGKIVGNMMLLGSLFMGVYFVGAFAVIAVGAVILGSGNIMDNIPLLVIAGLLLAVLYFVFLVVVSCISAVFWVRLGLTILENPKQKS